MNVQQSDLNDPALVTEVDLARAAAQEEAGDERVGEYVAYHIEDSAAVTHLFEADKPGYRGWRWAVTITTAGVDTDITVSEVVLLPGPSALVAPDWIPWQNRVQAGDLGVGDLLPTSPDDPRLVPAYAESDDPDVEETAMELGLGRVRVMSRPARLEAADRWHQSEYGPRSDMARSAPAHCGTCGFYLPLAGSLRAAFGTCGNELSPADAHVVHAEYGCGAHSEAEVEQVSPVLVADLIYDDAQLDVEPLSPAAEQAPAEASEPAPAPAAPIEALEPGPAEAVVPDSAETLEPAALDASPVESVPMEAVESAPVEAADSSSVEPDLAETAGLDPVEVVEAGSAKSEQAEALDASPAEAVEPGPTEAADSVPVEAVVPDPVETLEAAEALDSSPAEVAEPDQAAVEPGVVEALDSSPAEAAAVEPGAAQVAEPDAAESGVAEVGEPSPAEVEPEVPTVPAPEAAPEPTQAAVDEPVDAERR
jgi:Protein of unknown function (DUF3027)